MVRFDKILSSDNVSFISLSLEHEFLNYLWQIFDLKLDIENWNVVTNRSGGKTFLFFMFYETDLG